MSRAWRTFFIVLGVVVLGYMAYAHDVIAGITLLLGIVVGALLIVAGLRGRVL